jgi:hypothetical protein
MHAARGLAAVALLAFAVGSLPPAQAAHVYRFHLVKDAASGEFIRKCAGTSLLFPWRGRNYRPGRTRCLLSEGDMHIGWREYTILASYYLPAPTGQLAMRWTFTPLGYHTVSSTFAYCIPAQQGQPGSCQSRSFREKGSQWSNVW